MQRRHDNEWKNEIRYTIKKELLVWSRRLSEISCKIQPPAYSISSSNYKLQVPAGTSTTSNNVFFSNNVKTAQENQSFEGDDFVSAQPGHGKGIWSIDFISKSLDSPCSYARQLQRKRRSPHRPRPAPSLSATTQHK